MIKLNFGIKKFFISLFAFFAVGGLFLCQKIYAREIPTPIVKLPGPVKTLTWSPDGQYWGYSEGKSVVIRIANKNNEEAPIYATVENDSNIRNFRIVGKKRSTDNFVLTFDDYNSFLIRKMVEGHNVSDFINGVTFDHVTQYVTSAIYNDEGDMFVFGTENGEIFVLIPLMAINDFYTQYLEFHNGAITQLNFSNDFRFIVSGSIDGKIAVWKANGGALVAEMEQDYINDLPIVFANDNEHIICAKDEYTLSVRSLDGTEVQEIKSGAKILNFCLSPSGNDVIVVTELNQFCFYRVKGGRFTGYIPAWDNSPVTAYAFGMDGERVLIGHKSGNIYALRVADAYYEPGQIPVTYVPFDSHSKGAVGNGTGMDGDGAGLGAMFYRGRNDHSLEVRAGLMNLASPYGIGLNLGTAYLNGKAFQPFFFGGGVKFTTGIPTSSFPYEYKVNGQVIRNPWFYSIGLYVPAGITISPFPVEVEIFGEIQLGMKFQWISAGKGMRGKVWPAFDGNILLGCSYKGIEFFLSGGYESYAKFTFECGAGYRIRLDK